MPTDRFIPSLISPHDADHAVRFRNAPRSVAAAGALCSTCRVTHLHSYYASFMRRARTAAHPDHQPPFVSLCRVVRVGQRRWPRRPRPSRCGLVPARARPPNKSTRATFWVSTRERKWIHLLGFPRLCAPLPAPARSAQRRSRPGAHLPSPQPLPPLPLYLTNRVPPPSLQFRRDMVGCGVPARGPCGHRRRRALRLSPPALPLSRSPAPRRHRLTSPRIPPPVPLAGPGHSRRGDGRR